jgi:hypothetical protein
MTRYQLSVLTAVALDPLPSDITITKDQLNRLRYIVRPHPVIRELCTLLYILFSNESGKQRSPEDMWPRVRKFLARDDLELSLMFLNDRNIPPGIRSSCLKRINSLDELSVIRCGDEASNLYQYLQKYLAD